MDNKLRPTEVGFLMVNDIFYCDGQRYRILGLGNKEINDVRCVNLETNKIKWFDTTSDVEVLNV